MKITMFEIEENAEDLRASRSIAETMAMGIGRIADRIADAICGYGETVATEMFRRGMDINAISKLMGHSNISTTQRYIYTADEQLQAEYRKHSA